MTSRKIKLFVDAHVFDGQFQGTTTYLSGLYNSLVSDEELEITLAARNIENLKRKFPDQRFRFIELSSASKLKRLGFDIPRILREQQFDFAHFQYITPVGKKSCRYINTIHDLLFLDYPEYFPFSYRVTKKILFKKSALNSDILCTVSEYSKNAIVRHYGINDDQVVITPNAVQPMEVKFVDVKKKYALNKYILYVSRFEPRKNHISLLKAFVELKLYEMGYHLVFIGKYNDVKTDAYNKLYLSLTDEIRKFVLHLENIDVNELNCFYKQADLFVYPSLAEGFGIPPLEAAVAPCKVLCSNQTAMEDFDFFAPYQFDPRNIEELKPKILSSLSDENYPYQSIRSRVIDQYNWEVGAKNLKKALTT